MSSKTHKWKSTGNLGAHKLEVIQPNALSKSSQHLNYSITLNFENSEYFKGTKQPVDFIFKVNKTDKPISKAITNISGVTSYNLNALKNTGAISAIKPMKKKRKKKNVKINSNKVNIIMETKPMEIKVMEIQAEIPKSSVLTKIITDDENEQVRTKSFKKSPLFNISQISQQNNLPKLLNITSSRQQHKTNTETSSIPNPRLSTILSGSQSRLDNPLSVLMKRGFTYEKICDTEYIEINSLGDNEAVSLMKYLCIVFRSEKSENDEILLAIEDFKNTLCDHTWGTFRLLVVTNGFSIKDDILANSLHANTVKAQRYQNMLLASDDQTGENYMPRSIRIERTTDFSTEDEDSVNKDIDDPNFQWPDAESDDGEDNIDDDDAGIMMAKMMATKFRDSRVIGVNKGVTKTKDVTNVRSKVSNTLVNFAKKLENNIGVAHHTSLEITKFVEIINSFLYDVLERK